MENKPRTSTTVSGGFFSPPLNRTDGIAVAMGLLAVLAVRLWYWFVFDPPLGTDFPRYHFIAQSLFRLDFSHFIHYHYPPLYPIFLAPFTALISPPETAARTTNVFIGVLTAVALYLLCREVFDRRTAAAAIFLYAFKLLRIPFLGEAEPLLILLIFTGALLGLRALAEPTAARVAAAATVFGLAALAKMEGGAFFFLWLCWLSPRLLWRRTKLQGTGLAVLALVCYFLPQSPYLGAFYRDTGRITVHPKLATLFYLHNEPDWSEGSYALRRDRNGAYTVFQRVIGERDQRQQTRFWAYLRENRKRLTAVYLDRLGFTFRETVPALWRELEPGWGWATAVLLLLALIGPGIKWPQRVREIYLVCYFFLPLLLVPLFIPQYRFFSLTATGLIALLARGAERATSGVVVLADRARGHHRNGAKRAAVVLAALTALLLIPDVAGLGRHPGKNAYRQLVEDRAPVAEYIRRRLPSGGKIMSMWLEVPIWHLAGIEPERDISLPRAPLPDVIAYARQEGVTFIIVERNETARRYPELNVFFSPGFRHPDLEPVENSFGPNGRIYSIYRVK